MPPGIRAELVAGRTCQNVGCGTSGRFFASGKRRGQRLMCDGCLRGMHALCESEECPCVCNDADFRWARKPEASSPTQVEMARIVAIRPELAHLLESLR